VRTAEDVAVATELGVHALGIEAEFQGEGPAIDEEAIAYLGLVAPPDVRIVVLSELRDAKAIIERYGQVSMDAIQLCAAPDLEQLRMLRIAMSDVALIQTIDARQPGAFAEAQLISPLVDAIMLECGMGQMIYGRPDWSICRAIRDQIHGPVWLTGGLTPENVAEAIRAVQPDGVDVCRGVRGPNGLDRNRAMRFMAATR
jgi:phosphoribosylanthranilate isomerase